MSDQKTPTQNNALLKLVGFVLITVGLVLGVSSAPTAYVPPLSLDDAQLEGLTLAAPAGEIRTDDMLEHEVGEPIFKPTDADGAPVKGDANVKRIKVKEFAFGRWTGLWLFLLACGLLLGGAYLVRSDIKRRLAAAAQEAETGSVASPEAAFATIVATLEGLRRDLPHMTTDQDRQQAVIERLGEVQATHVPAVVDGRPLLISRMGLSSFAELMDGFAAMERQINRAWAAAADGVYEESADCLERASALAEETAKLLNG